VRRAHRLPHRESSPMEYAMFRFLLGIAVGIAVGMAVATAMQPKRRSTHRPAAGGGSGRVDELSAAVDHLPVDTASINAGDGTPSDGSAASRSGSPPTFDDARNRGSGVQSRRSVRPAIVSMPHRDNAGLLGRIRRQPSASRYGLDRP
jgi:hypothetical protein